MIAALGAGYGIRARIADGWTFMGADSFAYMGAAMELWESHRYAFRQPPWHASRPAVAPLGYGRLPGYPIVLAALVHASGASYDTYAARAKSLQRILDLGTCLLVFLIARRLGGRWAAWPAFLLAVVHPSLVLHSAAVLTETLATFLGTATLALAGYSLDRTLAPGRARAALIAAGAMAGLGALVRNDAILLLPCLVVPVLVRAARPRTVLMAFAAFALVFAAWPIRNLVRFGKPHALGSLTDVRGREMPRAAFYDWFATWVVREEQWPATMYCLMRPECVATVTSYPREAFDSAAERALVARLFELRRREGFSARVDDGFRVLARHRTLSHPVRTLVVLPAKRAFHQWVNPDDQPLRSAGVPWPTVMSVVTPCLKGLSIFTTVAGLAGLAALGLLRRFRDLRPAALMAALAIGVRTAFLAYLGLVDRRYLLEILPVVLVLAGVALGLVLRRGYRAIRPAPDVAEGPAET